MKIATRIFAVLFLVSICSGFVMAEDDMPTVSVQGMAEIRVAPDEGVLTFSIETREKEMDDAVNKLDSRMKEVVDFLKTSNIEADDIRTELLNIQPIFDTRRSYPEKFPMQTANNAPNFADKPDEDDATKLLKPVGYKARRQLSIVIKKLVTYENIYRGLLKRGVNEIGGIQFRSSELRKHKDEARKRAIIAAKEKAEALANELGASLAAVQTINELQHSYGIRNNFQNVMFDNGGSSDAAAVGMIEIKATISVVFKLGDTDM